MKKSTREVLIREYVRRLLSEDDYGYGMYSSDMAMGVSGYGSSSDFYNAFIGPFVDVFKTGLAGTKELATRARTVIWVGLQTVLTTVIPFYNYRYADVFEKEKERINAIRSEYRDVFDRTDEALASSDASLFAFMVSPGAFLAGKGVKASKGLLSAASGGLSDELYDKVKSGLESTGRWATGEDGRSGGSFRKSKNRKSPREAFNDWHIREAREDSKKDSKLGPEDIIKSKKFIDKSLSSPAAAKMKKAAEETYKASHKSLLDIANEMKSINSVEDLEREIKKMASKPPKGVKIPPMSEVTKALEDLKKLKDPKEKKKSEQMLLDAFKKSPGEFLAKQLTAKLEADTKAIADAGGKPEETQYVKDTKDTIQKLKAI